MDFSIISRGAMKAVGFVKFHSPTILVCAGVAGLAGTIYLAARAGVNHEYAKQNVEQELSIDLTDEARDSIKKEYVMEEVKIWAPVVGCGLATAACFVGGHVISVKRVNSMMAAYGLLQESYKKLSERYKEAMMELPEEKRKELLSKHSGYSLFGELSDAESSAELEHLCDHGFELEFDIRNHRYEAYHDANQLFLMQRTHILQKQLKELGVVSVNDALLAFGFAPIASGQVTGWLFEDGLELDFGVGDIRNMDWRNGIADACILRFDNFGTILNAYQITPTAASPRMLVTRF
jgi:hypothetical protein